MKQIIFFSITSLLAIYQISKAKFSTDLLDLLPANSKMQSYRDVATNFNPLDRSFFVLTAKPADTLVKHADQLVAQLKKTKLFSTVTGKLTAEELLKVREILKKHRALLYDQADHEATLRKIDYQSMKNSIESWRNELLSSPAPFLNQMFENDPFKINDFITSKLQSMKGFSGNTLMYRGYLLSKDKSGLLVIAQPLKTATDTEFSQRFVNTMETLLGQFKPFVKIAYLSGHRYAFENERFMRQDIALVSTISIFMILILAYLLFRQPIRLVIVLLPVGYGAIMAIAVCSLLNEKISIAAIGCGSILLGIGVDYVIHFLVHIENSTLSTKTAFAEIKRPLFVSAATTIAAFLCLQLSDLPIFNQFGQIAVIGILASFLVTVWCLPNLIQSNVKAKQVRTAERIYQRLYKHRRYALGVLATLTLLSSFFIGKIRFDGDLKNLYAMSPALRADLKTVQSLLGETVAATSVVVSGNTLEEALTKNDRLKLLLDSEEINSYSSIAAIVPSRYSQDDHLRNWSKLQNHLNSKQTLKTFEWLALEYGLSKGFFQNMLAQLPFSADYITPSTYERTNLENLISSHISSTNQVLTTVTLKNKDSFPDFAARVKLAIPDAIAVNSRDFVSSVVKMINQEFLTLGFTVLLIVTLILLVAYRAKKSLWVLLPIFLSLLWTFGFLGLIDLPINIMNCMIVLFVFALIIDYSVFLFNATNEPHFGDSLTAVTFSSLTTLVGLGILSFASHPALATVGTTTLIAMLSGNVAVILTALISRSTTSR